MITITDAARDKFKELLAARGSDNLALWVAIRGRGPQDFIYDLRIINEADTNEADQLVELDGLRLYVDAESADNLKGATVDFITAQNGFKITNPNPMWTDPLEQRVHEVIMQQINPGIAAHGGMCMLLGVEGDTAFIELGGGCVGCGLVDVTLKQGIEVMIKRDVPEIQHVVDRTDHASGTNPYYQPTKSPQHTPSK